jgi:hypothetical protein
MTTKIEILVPEGRSKTLPILPAPRLVDLRRQVIGFLQNGKPNADILLARLAKLMQEKYGLKEVRSRAKPRASEPAVFIEEMANECQGVVNAIGD